jgi:penicillin-binding protein 1A
VLTRRGADILVRVEKMLDEAAKAVADAPPSKTTSSGAATPPESFAAATSPAPRKN